MKVITGSQGQEYEHILGRSSNQGFKSLQIQD